jgi:homoserine dehydrogenase
MYYGAGAGGNATASAVIANIIDIARRGKGSPMLGFNKPLESGLTLAEKNDIETNYYIRLKVEDKTGVLASVASILSKCSISIEKILQKPLESGFSNLLLATHKSKESDIIKALEEIEKLDFIQEKPAMIRIES